jgi:hypothetical protein
MRPGRPGVGPWPPPRRTSRRVPDERSRTRVIRGRPGGGRMASERRVRRHPGSAVFSTADRSDQYRGPIRSVPRTDPIAPPDPSDRSTGPIRSVPRTDPIAPPDPSDRSAGPIRSVPRTDPIAPPDPSDRSTGPIRSVPRTDPIAPPDPSDRSAGPNLTHARPGRARSGGRRAALKRRDIPAHRCHRPAPFTRPSAPGGRP